MFIRCKHGWRGYGLALGIVEVLREQEDFGWRIDRLDGLVHQLHVSTRQLKDVVSAGIEGGFFEETADGCVRCPMLTENMAQMAAKREKLVQAGRKRWEASESSDSGRSRSSQADAKLEPSITSPPTIREDESKKDHNIKEKGEEEERNTNPVHEEKVSYAPGIAMKPSERDELVKKVGEKAVTFYERQVSDHFASEGKSTKDAAAIIRKWIRNDQVQCRGFFANGPGPGLAKASNRPERQIIRALCEKM